MCDVDLLAVIQTNSCSTEPGPMGLNRARKHTSKVDWSILYRVLVNKIVTQRCHFVPTTKTKISPSEQQQPGTQCPQLCWPNGAVACPMPSTSSNSKSPSANVDFIPQMFLCKRPTTQMQTEFHPTFKLKYWGGIVLPACLFHKDGNAKETMHSVVFLFSFFFSALADWMAFFVLQIFAVHWPIGADGAVFEVAAPRTHSPRHSDMHPLRKRRSICHWQWRRVGHPAHLFCGVSTRVRHQKSRRWSWMTNSDATKCSARFDL